MSETVSAQVEQEVQQNGDLLPPTTLPQIPVPTADVNALLRTVQALKQVVDAFMGTGPVQNRALTVGDAFTEGIAQAAVGNVQLGSPGDGSVFVSSDGGYVDPRPVLSKPPTLTDLTALGTFRAVVVQWDRVDYQNHRYSEVWRNTVNDLSTAVLIGTAEADLYTDSTVVVSTTYYYWARAVGYAPTDGSTIVGDFNAGPGTPGGAQLIGNTDLGPLIVEAANLANNAVTSVKITDDAITAPKLSANCIAVGTAAIQNGAITNAMMGTASIDTANIVDEAVETSKIADAAITNAKIADATITNAKIVNLSATKIAAGALGVGQYIQSTNYVPGSAGWAIKADGTAEFGAVSIRGQLTTNQIEVTAVTQAHDGTESGSSYTYSGGTGTITNAVDVFSYSTTGSPVTVLMQVHAYNLDLSASISFMKISMQIQVDGVNQGLIGERMLRCTNSASLNQSQAIDTQLLIARLTPSAGSHTYSVSVTVRLYDATGSLISSPSGGGGGIDAYAIVTENKV